MADRNDEKSSLVDRSTGPTVTRVAPSSSRDNGENVYLFIPNLIGIASSTSPPPTVEII